MRLALAAVALIVAAGPGWAGDYHALTGKVLKTYCQMGTCEWEQVNDATSVGESTAGELFKVEATTWEGAMERKSPRGLPPGHSTSYVFCSRSRPAVLFGSSGKWMVTEIAPGSPDTISHFNSSAVGEYWLICHGIAAHDLEAIGKTLGRKFGYKADVTNDSLGQKDVNRPEELLSR